MNALSKVYNFLKHPLDDSNKGVYNFLFHPLEGEKESTKIWATITFIALSVFTGGLYWIPFGAMQWRDRKIIHLKDQTVSDQVFEDKVSKENESVGEVVGEVNKRKDIDKIKENRYRYAKKTGSAATAAKLVKQARMANANLNAKKRGEQEFKYSDEVIKNGKELIPDSELQWDDPSEKIQLQDGTVVGTSSTIGLRSSMEDEHIVTAFDFKVGDALEHAQLLGVFDGHGGSQASAFVKKEIQAMLLKELEASDKLDDEVICNALMAVCVKLSERIAQGEDSVQDRSGTTATIAFIRNDQAYIANVGDTRAVFVSNDGKVTQLSEDADPSEERFKKGVTSRGGFVGMGRVNMQLAVAREIGMQSDDVSQHAIVPRPKIVKHNVKKGFLCIACDGLWDVASSNEVGKAVIDLDKEGKSPEKIAEALKFGAVGCLSGDNVSVLVAKFS